MDSIPAGGTRDNVDLASRVALTVFCLNVHLALLLLSDGTKTAVDDDVEAVTDVACSP